MVTLNYGESAAFVADVLHTICEEAETYLKDRLMRLVHPGGEVS